MGWEFWFLKKHVWLGPPNEDSGLPFSKPKNRFFQNWKDNIHLICQDSYFLVIYLFKLGYFKQSYFFRSCPLYRQIYLAWWVIPFLGKIVCIREIQYEIHSFAKLCLWLSKGGTLWNILFCKIVSVCMRVCLAWGKYKHSRLPRGQLLDSGWNKHTNTNSKCLSLKPLW